MYKKEELAMHVNKMEINCIEEALKVVKKTDKFQKNMENTVKDVLNAKYLLDTTLFFFQKDTNVKYDVLHTAESMEVMINLISEYINSKKDAFYVDGNFVVLSEMLKRVYSELIKYEVAK